MARTSSATLAKLPSRTASSVRSRQKRSTKFIHERCGFRKGGRVHHPHILPPGAEHGCRYAALASSRFRYGLNSPAIQVNSPTASAPSQLAYGPITGKGELN